MRMAICLAANRLGSSISTFPSGASADNSNGRSVDLPAPGGAVTTARGQRRSDPQSRPAISATGNCAPNLSNNLETSIILIIFAQNITIYGKYKHRDAP